MTTPTPTGPQYTGRQVIVLAPSRANPERALARIAGLENIARTKDFESQALEVSAVGGADATIFDELGVAVVSGDADQQSALAAAAERGDVVLSVEPELIHHALVGTAMPVVSTPPTDTDEFTWGLLATGVSTTSKTGSGVRLAVLDTGFDVAHPDFTGRVVMTQSFIVGESVQDAHGHGTHCIGTSCGPSRPEGTRRYGVAPGVEIYAGKVLSDSGSGTDTGILAGINWAMANDCAVISMSLGADVPEVSRAYETVGKRALDRGTLIIAAAGNNARRPGNPGFVGVPANSPSIMAIAALDKHGQPARFSARSGHPDGGKIDLAGPGVNVFSSWPMSQRYHTISGTSMATPHVSGIAALWAEATGMTGRDLWTVLVQNARALDVPTVDVGAGLVQAPQ
ncbi:S8 family peptidase [Mycobacterium hubeiense]|uniref:S8 family peptidase n=1 Tax=Mycobacterium hubeiense TaxID=1867256 RepID=UPI000C7ECE74|nr:S8 family serine peptidase [Mycobacterium sp. QGD 101]